VPAKGEGVLTMSNTNRDMTDYDHCHYQRDISDGNALYDAFLLSKNGSEWKPHVQLFEMSYLLELAKIQKELKERTYEFSPSTQFVLFERGKERVINGEMIQDRIVKHSLCDEVLNPAIQRKLIYDNSASQKGKGIDFARRRLLVHLRKYYAHHKSNDGYILIIDYSKYYDNIRHDVLMEQLRKCTDDECAFWLLGMIIDRSKVDVSYMTDEEYSHCMDSVFSSLEYQKIDPALLTGKKYMAKHLNIGDQVAQVAGIIYPSPIDNYVKIVKGAKYYARYMDDSYVIHESRDFLEKLLDEIIEIAAGIGITINRRKTHIYKLSELWRFLQVQYSLTDSGRVIQKINPKRLHAMHRKMKKLSSKMNCEAYHNWFNAWYGSSVKYMSKIQKRNLDNLYGTEVEKCIA
jgi:hypothetical protein